jgi:hypothetical protein
MQQASLGQAVVSIIYPRSLRSSAVKKGGLLFVFNSKNGYNLNRQH